MDPITLGLGSFIFGAKLTTNKPRWEQNLETSCRFSAPHVDRRLTDLPIWGRRQPEASTSKLVSTVVPFAISDARDLLIEQIKNYAELPDDWNGEGASAPSIASFTAATDFLASFPAGIPLPKPMLNTSGAIEFYWDLQSGYADISFDTEGAGSFFSKLRTGVEFFQDDLEKSDFTQTWFLTVFSSLCKQQVLVTLNEQPALIA